MTDLSVIYRRVSTDHQDNSLQVQEALNDEYCKRLHLATTGPSIWSPDGQSSEGLSFADDDVSGSIPFLERPGSRALLQRLQRGDIQHLVTAKQDRLGRDTLDQIATIRHVWGLGITPHFPAEGGALPRNPQNELLFEIKASVAQYERNLIRDRTRAVLHHKFARNQLTGKVPFGFDCIYRFKDGATHHTNHALSAKELAHLGQDPDDVVAKDLVANPAEQAAVRLMWRLRHTDRLTLEAVAAELNRRGLRPKLGGAWQFGNVDSVLRSRYTQKILQTPAP
jgi:DNA invertase Pin-like site-specific DNA recombinase